VAADVSRDHASRLMTTAQGFRRRALLCRACGNTESFEGWVTEAENAKPGGPAACLGSLEGDR
jgi:hypothetical protein